MTNILVLGANGQIARQATRLLLERTREHLRLYLRQSDRLRSIAAAAPDGRVELVDGDVLATDKLEAAMVGMDVVYANLSGQMEQQARALVAAMPKAGVTRLIFISSMGVHDEVPGERYGSILTPYRNATKVIEASPLDYTIIRPAWLNDRDDIAYGTTLKGEAFRNKDRTVSRKSVADLVVKLISTPGLHRRESVGVHGV